MPVETFRKVLIQIATPYSTGTGFYLQDVDLIVTSEFVVRDNREVIIDGLGFERQLTPVLYTDAYYDLAFLAAPKEGTWPMVALSRNGEVILDDRVYAIGHPFGLQYKATEGRISKTDYRDNDIYYLQHDALLSPGNSGGPLVNERGEIIGINTFINRDGEPLGYSLPVHHLLESIKAFRRGKGAVGIRCYNCKQLVFKHTKKGNQCPECGTGVQLPSCIEPYEARGMAKTIEDMLEALGHPVDLSRRGPGNWQIHQGSAKIDISYYEKNGLIIGDAYLCTLPTTPQKTLFKYLLRQNDEIENLTFSVKEQYIVLSLLIYDRYLNMDTGLEMFRHLFERADYYDNILVEQYQASWIVEED